MKSRNITLSLIPLLALTSAIAACGYEEPQPKPAEETTTAEDEPETYEDGSIPYSAIIPDPDSLPPESLWLDPLTGDSWFVGGLGTVDKALNLCYGNYRSPTYYELYRASIDGLAKFDPKITTIWSLDSAFFDSESNEAKTFYVDLSDSSMKPGSASDVRGLACIWDAK